MEDKNYYADQLVSLCSWREWPETPGIWFEYQQGQYFLSSNQEVCIFGAPTRLNWCTFHLERKNSSPVRKFKSCCFLDEVLRRVVYGGRQTLQWAAHDVIWLRFANSLHYRNVGEQFRNFALCFKFVKYFSDCNNPALLWRTPLICWFYREG